MKQVKTILAFLSHFLFIGVILFLWFPFAQLYYQSVPTMGSDFLQFPTYVAYIKEHFQLPPTSWKYIWFSGAPLIFDYPWLHFYLTLPLTFFLSAVKASLLYLILSMFAYLFFSYLMLYQLSRSRFVSMMLVIALASSTSFYKTLFDGGAATFAASRMFLPLVLFFLIKYFRQKDGRFLLLAGLAMGLAGLGHTGVLLLIMLPSALIFFCFWKDRFTPLVSFSKIKGSLLLFLVSLLVGGATLYTQLMLIIGNPNYNQFGLVTKVHENTFTGIAEFTNPLLFALFILLAILLGWRKKVKEVPEAIPFLAVVFYLLVSSFLYLVGRHPLSQAMGPDRLWFVFPLLLAGLIALFWRVLFPFPEVGWRTKKILLPLLSLVIFIPIFFSFNMPALPFFGASFQEKLAKTVSKVGYPTNAQAFVINGQKEEVDKIVNPPWLEAGDINYRYYALQGAVETWWNAIFPLPMAHGYANVLKAKANDWLYWVDNTLLGEYVWHFNVSAEIAKQHALFLLDWYAIRYFEGGGLPLADYLEKDKGVTEIGADLNQGSDPIKPYKFKDEVTSPIVRPTNSPTILLVGNTVAYDTLLKVLATENLNSRSLIPIHGPEYLEDISSWDLADFDIVFLYSYKYRNEKDFRFRPGKVWKKLEEYVGNGGKLMIETGGEVVDSNSVILADRKLDKLPGVFPIEKTYRDELGQDWNLTTTESSITQGVEFEKFSQLIYEEVPWKLSYSDGKIRPWAKTILAQQGKPILVTGDLGKGKVVWSGVNLPYHFLYYLNLAEEKLLINIFKELVVFGREEDIRTAKVERPNPEKIIISGTGFSGVVLKETFDVGWQGQLSLPQNKSLKVYRAGPYYMYLRIPKVQGEVTAGFNFRGSLAAWSLFIVSLATSLLIIFKGIFKSTPLKFISILTRQIKGRLRLWWGKEEE